MLYQYIHDYLHNIFHIPSFGGLLITPFKPKAKESYMCLSYCYFTLYKNIAVTKVAYFSMVCYHSCKQVVLVSLNIVPDGRKLGNIALACPPMASYEISCKLVVSRFRKLKCGAHTEAAWPSQKFTFYFLGRR
jgi:hypothetical protein